MDYAGAGLALDPLPARPAGEAAAAWRSGGCSASDSGRGAAGANSSSTWTAAGYEKLAAAADREPAPATNDSSTTITSPSPASLPTSVNPGEPSPVCAACCEPSGAPAPVVNRPPPPPAIVNRPPPPPPPAAMNRPPTAPPAAAARPTPQAAKKCVVQKRHLTHGDHCHGAKHDRPDHARGARLRADYPADSQHFNMIDPWARRRC
jgi:hypothetical protein